MISAETIDSYFEQLDWPFDREDEHNWTTGYQGENATFPVFVHSDEFWLFVYAPLPVEIHPATMGMFYQHLLVLSHAFNLAKFTLDDGDQLGIAAELPNDGLQSSAFELALQDDL